MYYTTEGTLQRGWPTGDQCHTNTICRINIFSSNIDGHSGEVKVSSMNASETWMMTNGNESFALAEQPFSFLCLDLRPYLQRRAFFESHRLSNREWPLLYRG